MCVFPQGRCKVYDLDPDHWHLYKSAAPLFKVASWPCTWLIHGHVQYGALVYKPNCDLVSSLSFNLLSAKYTDKNLYLLVVKVWARYGIIPRVQKKTQYYYFHWSNHKGLGTPPPNAQRLETTFLTIFQKIQKFYFAKFKFEN